MGFEINWLYIGIPSAAIGALLILLLIVVCVRRQKRKSKSKAAMKNPYCGPIINGTSIARVPGQQMEMSALLPPGNGMATLQGPITNRILAPEFSLHAVRFQQDLGEGAFGKVKHFEKHVIRRVYLLIRYVWIFTGIQRWAYAKRWHVNSP